MQLPSGKWAVRLSGRRRCGCFPSRPCAPCAEPLSLSVAAQEELNKRGLMEGRKWNPLQGKKPLVDKLQVRARSVRVWGCRTWQQHEGSSDLASRLAGDAAWRRAGPPGGRGLCVCTARFRRGPRIDICAAHGLSGATRADAVWVRAAAAAPRVQEYLVQRRAEVAASDTEEGERTRAAAAARAAADAAAAEAKSAAEAAAAAKQAASEARQLLASPPLLVRQGLCRHLGLHPSSFRPPIEPLSPSAPRPLSPSAARLLSLAPLTCSPGPGPRSAQDAITLSQPAPPAGLPPGRVLTSHSLESLLAYEDSDTRECTFEVGRPGQRQLAAAGAHIGQPVCGQGAGRSSRTGPSAGAPRCGLRRWLGAL
jgi:hypothetical protein